MQNSTLACNAVVQNETPHRYVRSIYVDGLFPLRIETHTHTHAAYTHTMKIMGSSTTVYASVILRTQFDTCNVCVYDLKEP